MPNGVEYDEDLLNNNDYHSDNSTKSSKDFDNEKYDHIKHQEDEDSAIQEHNDEVQHQYNNNKEYPLAIETPPQEEPEIIDLIDQEIDPDNEDFHHEEENPKTYKFQYDEEEIIF
eukprot:7011958-Ditylum_brightwellii.AAC.1